MFICWSTQISGGAHWFLGGEHRSLDYSHSAPKSDDDDMEIVQAATMLKVAQIKRGEPKTSWGRGNGQVDERRRRKGAERRGGGPGTWETEIHAIVQAEQEAEKAECTEAQQRVADAMEYRVQVSRQPTPMPLNNKKIASDNRVEWNTRYIDPLNTCIQCEEWQTLCVWDLMVIHVGCIYAPDKLNPNIFQFYFNFSNIFHHTSMHPFLHNFYEFYLNFIILFHLLLSTKSHLYSRWHFHFDSIWHQIC